MEGYKMTTGVATTGLPVTLPANLDRMGLIISPDFTQPATDLSIMFGSKDQNATKQGVRLPGGTQALVLSREIHGALVTGQIHIFGFSANVLVTVVESYCSCKDRAAME